MNKKLYLSWLNNVAKESAKKIHPLNESRTARHINFLHSVIATLLSDRGEDKEKSRREKEAGEPVNVQATSNLKDFNLMAPPQSVKTSPSPPAWSYNIRNALGLSNAIGGAASGTNSVYEGTASKISTVATGNSIPAALSTKAAASGQVVRRFKSRPGSNQRRLTLATPKPKPTTAIVRVSQPAPAPQPPQPAPQPPKPTTAIVRVPQPAPAPQPPKPTTAIVRVPQPPQPPKPGGPIVKKPGGPIVKKPGGPIVKSGGSKPLTPKVPMRLPGDTRGSFSGSDLPGIPKGPNLGSSGFTRSISPRTSFGSAGAVSVQAGTGQLMSGSGSGSANPVDPLTDTDDPILGNRRQPQSVYEVVYKPTVGTLKTKSRVSKSTTPQSTSGTAAKIIHKDMPLGENTLKSLVSHHVDKFLKTRHGEKLKNEAEDILKSN